MFLELADHFGLFFAIRRDLDFREARHQRQYGIATLLNPYGRPSGGSGRIRFLSGAEATRYVEDGDCIFINTNSALGMLGGLMLTT